MQEMLPEHLPTSPLEIDKPCWYHALTLKERLASLQAQRSPTRREEPCDDELAARKLQAWKTQDAFRTGLNFAHRLEAEQITEDDLLLLLGEPIEAVQQRTAPPDWLSQLAEVFASIDLASEVEEDTRLSFLNIFDIVRQYAYNRFASRAAALDAGHKQLPFDPQTIASAFWPNLLPSLSQAITHTMTLELDAAQSRLHGETAEERCQQFIRQIRQKQAVQALMEAYPVLARQIMGIVDRWLDYSLEFLHRLCSDWQQIGTTFSPEREPGQLIEAQASDGDGLRSTLKLRFSSGLQLLYRPQSLEVDRCFQEMLGWLNEQGYHPHFRTLRLLPGEGYGWSEFVEVSACATPDEIARFYERLGGQLALLYALNATNFHHENLIASGEHPILMNLEDLFYARTRASVDPDASIDIQQFSVMRTGMLPIRIKNDVDLLEYQSSLISGFKHMYQLLMSQSKEFIRVPLARFADVKMRRTVRPTHFYRQILDDSFHPDLLRDALERDRHFDRLWQMVKVQPDLARLVGFERADLLIGDIPTFITCPATRDLFSSRADCIASFLERPGIAIAQQTVLNLHEDDLERQRWFIEASLSTLLMEKGRHMEKRPTVTLPVGKAVTRERLLAAACRIGDHICKLATGDERGVNWIGITFNQQDQWFLTPMMPDLYDGNTGIIFFLSYLGIITGDTRYSDIAERAYLTMYKQLGRFEAHQQTVGLFEGMGSIIYLLAHLGAIWNDYSLLSEAHRQAKRLPDLIQKDTELDLLRGSAGCMLSLLSLYHVFPEAEILEMALMCGDHLLEKALEGKSSTSEEARTGMSHGTAGIVLSLFALASISGKERFRRRALAILADEREALSLQARPDILEPELSAQASLVGLTSDHGVGYQATWCHGAPGIALARLASLRYNDDEKVRAEIAMALQTTVANFGRNHSLCHGDLGNLETLLVATQMLDDAWCHQQFAHFRGVILDSIETDGWLTGAPSGIQSPGLMTGLAGIGYALLRLAEPERVPSILLAAAPLTQTAHR